MLFILRHPELNWLVNFLNVLFSCLVSLQIQIPVVLNHLLVVVKSQRWNLLELLFALLQFFFLSLIEIFIFLQELLFFKQLFYLYLFFYFQLSHSYLLVLPDTFSLISCYFPAHAHLFACFLGLLVITVHLRHVVDVVVVANTFGLDRVLKVVSVVK
jgi:hypothetical protein